MCIMTEIHRAAVRIFRTKNNKVSLNWFDDHSVKLCSRPLLTTISLFGSRNFLFNAFIFVQTSKHDGLSSSRGSQTYFGHVPPQPFDRWACTPKTSYDIKAEEIKKNIFTNNNIHHGRPQGGGISIYPLEIWTTNQKFLENRKSAS